MPAEIEKAAGDPAPILNGSSIHPHLDFENFVEGPVDEDAAVSNFLFEKDSVNFIRRLIIGNFKLLQETSTRLSKSNLSNTWLVRSSASMLDSLGRQSSWHLKRFCSHMARYSIKTIIKGNFVLSPLAAKDSAALLSVPPAQ